MNFGYANFSFSFILSLCKVLISLVTKSQNEDGDEVDTLPDEFGFLKKC